MARSHLLCLRLSCWLVFLLYEAYAVDIDRAVRIHYLVLARLLYLKRDRAFALLLYHIGYQVLGTLEDADLTVNLA